MGLTLAEVYKCRLNEDGLELIDVFAKMVKWWAERAGNYIWGRYSSFRDSFYKDWLRAFPEWSTQLAHTSSLEAYSRVRLYEPLEERAIAAELDTPAAVLHPKMLKIENGHLRITARRKPREDKYVYVELEPLNRQQRKLLKQAEKGLWRMGQAVITRDWALISFTTRRIRTEILKIVAEILLKG